MKADRGATVAQAQRDAALTPEQHLIPHVTLLGWEHIYLTGEIASGATRQRQQRAATTDPRTFCMLLSKILPTQVTGDGEAGPVRIEFSWLPPQTSGS